MLDDVEASVRRKVIDIRTAAGGKIIEANDTVAVLQKPFAEM